MNILGHLPLKNQAKKGKENVVRGFALAEVVVTICRPHYASSAVTSFYEAFVEGHGEPRLYIQWRAKRETLATYFAKALSYVLYVSVIASVVLSFYKNRLPKMADGGGFRDFDPFGDFEVLFPASLWA